MTNAVVSMTPKRNHNDCDNHKSNHQHGADGCHHHNDNNNGRFDEKSLHIAPMLDVTNREFRQLLRILSRRCVLWTEMVVDETILYTKDLGHHLDYDTNSHPIVCQIGGSDPETLYDGCLVLLRHGYDEININMGCPSDRVSGERTFGAVLMKMADTAERCVEAMTKATKDYSINNPQSPPVPISVKCRIGIDELDSIEFMVELIERLSKRCTIFYLHARKCVLGGILSPAQNRAVPPLNYPRVYEICRRFPHLQFYINGGIPDLKAAKDICFGSSNFSHVTTELPCQYCQFSNGGCVAPLVKAPPNLLGCQLGRTARDNPCVLWDVDRYFYNEAKNPCRNRREVLDKYCKWLEMIYPRRCCDVRPKQTTRILSNVDEIIPPEYDCCPICAEFFNKNDDDREEDPSLSVAPDSYANQGPKFTTHVLYRSVRPIWGIFFGLPSARKFRRELDRIIVQDLHMRNCGPTIMIKKALKEVPSTLLDQPFIYTEDLTEPPTNHNESIGQCCRNKMGR